MLKQIKIDWKQNKSTFFLTLLFYPLIFLVGDGLVAVAIWVDNDPSDWIPLGTILTLFMPLIYSFIRGMFYPQSFNLSLSMGQTRRDFMLTYALRQLAWLVCGYVLILLLNRVEMAALTALKGSAIDDGAFWDFLTDLKIFLPAILALVLIHMFVGSLYCRFGKVCGIVLYAVWMAGCFGSTRLLHEDSPFLALLQAVPTAGWIALALTAAAAMLAFTVTQGRKYSVR